MGTLPTRTAPRRRRRMLLALAALAMVGLAAGQLSLALFTDQETVAATFGTGSIILDDVKIDALTLTTGAMMPGDTITDDVVVENDGDDGSGRQGPSDRADPNRQDDRRHDAAHAVRQLRRHQRAGGHRPRSVHG